MNRAAVCLSVLALAGCASSACSSVRPSSVSIPVPDVVERVIVVRVPATHSVILGTYANTVTQEHEIVPKASATQIYRIMTLDASARRAIAPLRAPHHRATPEEIAKAMTAIVVLQAFVQAQRH
jgi:hypothetical protein